MLVHPNDRKDSMVSLLRARGVLRTAGTWAVGLSLLASTLLVLGIEFGVVPASVFGIRELVALAVRTFVAGGIAGGLFALLVARREQGRDIAELSYRRIGSAGFVCAAALGVLLGLAAPGVLPASVLIAGTLGLGMLGSGFAIGSLALARRAEGTIAVAKLESGSSDRLPLSRQGSLEPVTETQHQRK